MQTSIVPQMRPVFVLLFLASPLSASGGIAGDAFGSSNATLASLAASGVVGAEARDEAWDGRPLLFIGVCSGARDVARRQEIRGSYWQDPVLADGSLAEARFVVGQPPRGSALEEQLREELVARPQDFLRLAVPDGGGAEDGDAEAAAAKTVALLAWFARHSRARFLLKLEADALPRLRAIVPMLRALPRGPEAELVQLGALVPCRERRPADESAWNHSHYPRHVAGGGYVLSAGLARRLDATRDLERRRRLSLEDATVGMWLEMDSRADPGFSARLGRMNVTIGGCSAGDLVSTGHAPGQISCSWKRMLHGEADVCCPAPAAESTGPRSSLLQVGASHLLATSARRVAHRRGASLLRQERPTPTTGEAEPDSESACYSGLIRE